MTDRRPHLRLLFGEVVEIAGYRIDKNLQLVFSDIAHVHSISSSKASTSC